MRKEKRVSLATLVSKHLQLELDSEEFCAAYRLSLMYLARAISAFEFQHAVKAYTFHRTRRPDLPSAKVFRLKLLEHTYITLNVKLATLRCGKLRSAALDDFKQLAEEYHLMVADAKRMYRIWTADRKFRVAIKERVKEIPKDGDHWSVDYHHSTFGLIYKALGRTVNYLVKKKLWFVFKHHNIGLPDLAQDVMIHLWGRYCLMVPTAKTALHLINILKAAAKNAITNLCKKYSAEKNSRLVCTGVDRNNQRQFVLLVESQNQGSEEAVHDGDANPYPNLELAMSVRAVVDDTKNVKKHRLLCILLGLKDALFTEWLHAKGHAKLDEDNSDVQDRICPQKFNELVAQHFKLEQAKMVSYLREVGRRLLPEKSNALYGT